jgi:hypothetical protein
MVFVFKEAPMTLYPNETLDDLGGGMMIIQNKKALHCKAYL